MRPFDFLGLKNFRVFDDNNGFLEDLSSINILTGANNSGKSSLIKSLQMLKNSIKERQYPFDLDLTSQEHLLGDFENLLFNKNKREVEISLPFTFLGMRNIYISLRFDVPFSNDTYKAYLRAIKVIDQTDNSAFFSFIYREADEQEKYLAKLKFEEQVAHYKKAKSERSEGGKSITHSGFLFPPFENPLIGYVEWTMQLDKLKADLITLKEFYERYLNERESWKPLDVIDRIFDKSGVVPSLLVKSFKGDVPIDGWTKFIETALGNKNEITGKESVGERDFEPEDFFFPTPGVEDILYSEALKILKNNLKWTSVEQGDTTYSVLEHSFQSSWRLLVNRISTINYVSTTKEENLRIYNASSSSAFVKLLRDYSDNGHINSFVKKYLKAFEIGKEIKVDYQLKYQLMSVSITTLDGNTRELVDFGYGMKQLIDFLIQINVLAEKNKRIEHGYDDDGEFMRDVYDPSLLLIEEPESNLHPKWQSLIAEMFMEANVEFNIQLIIETHSEYLIRKFQTLVANKKLDGDAVKIFYLRNAKISGDRQQVESVTIKEDGSINYKVFDTGFFDESEKLELSLLNIQRDRFWKEFQYLKDSQQENEDKIVELEKKIDDFTNKVYIEVYRQIITNRFHVIKLTTSSVQHLISGQFLLANIDSQDDFSPVIIQYGRAIENELVQIFQNIDPTKKWMLGPMRGSLETFKNGRSTLPSCSRSELAQLHFELTNLFNIPTNLRIDLLNELREERNSAGHAGVSKTKQDAVDYIEKANDFLVVWINEKK